MQEGLIVRKRILQHNACKSLGYKYSDSTFVRGMLGKCNDLCRVHVLCMSNISFLLTLTMRVSLRCIGIMPRSRIPSISIPNAPPPLYSRTSKNLGIQHTILVRWLQRTVTSLRFLANAQTQHTHSAQQASFESQSPHFPRGSTRV